MRNQGLPVARYQAMQRIQSYKNGPAPIILHEQMNFPTTGTGRETGTECYRRTGWGDMGA